jgi:hypothetical protein
MAQPPAARAALQWDSPDANFLYWSKVGLWSADESVALLLGKSPDAVHWRSVQPVVGISEFAQEFERLRQLILHAAAMGWGQRPMPPVAVMRWAVDAGVDVPAALWAAVQARQAKKSRLAQSRGAAGAAAAPGRTEARPQAASPEAAVGGPGGPSEESPRAASVVAERSRGQRRGERLRERRQALIDQGVRNVTRCLAQGLSPQRVRTLLRRR